MCLYVFLSFYYFDFLYMIGFFPSPFHMTFPPALVSLVDAATILIILYSF